MQDAVLKKLVSKGWVVKACNSISTSSERNGDRLACRLFHEVTPAVELIRTAAGGFPACYMHPKIELK